MDGEKPSGSIPALARMGSPPHGRGKADPTDRNRTAFRITPAWAGKSFRCCRRGHCEKDHPRVGGEKFHSAAEIDEKMGSPPHRRGKVIVNLILTKGHRITPAWAGKRVCFPASVPPVQDHPRVGGEKHLSGTTDNRPQGSPPRGRGKVGPHSARKIAAGITPAWAGKSQQWPHMCGRSWDHPRVGGEKGWSCPHR